MYCSNCGNKVDEKAVVCVKCGVAVNGKVATPKTSSSAGKGKGIASMVLGIIGAFYALIAFSSTSSALVAISYYETGAEVIGFGIGFVLIQSALATIAICLSTVERKHFKNGFNTSGFWLSIATFACIALQFLILVFSY